MRDVISFHTAAGPAQAANDALAAALAELVETEHRASVRDLLDALLLPWEDADLGGHGERSAAA